MKKKNAFGIFSFFTDAGFLDLGFEDAGEVAMMAACFSRAETQRRREDVAI